VWNTTAGGDSNAASPGSGVGNYVAAENSSNAFDLNPATKYNSYGPRTSASAFSDACDVNTGAYFTPSGGSSLLQSIQFCAANDSPNRDPLTVTVEGSNGPSSALTFGSSWSLIYNGSTGLDTDPGRTTYGIIQNISNSVWYLSYRVLVTSKRDIEDSCQYAEVHLVG
jgi:hypothetical protein